MRRLLVAVLCFTTSAAFAQVDDHDDDGVPAVQVQVPGVQVQVPGVQVQVNPGRTAPRAPAPAPGPAARVQPPPRAFGGDAFSIEYGPLLGVPGSAIKIVSPEAATAEVWAEDGTLAGTFSVPFLFQGRSEQYYRFILVGQDGLLLLDKKFQTKQFIGGLIKYRAAAPAPAQAQAVAAAAQGMAEADFEALVNAVNDAGFGHEKLGVIDTAAQSHFFTIEQVGKLVDLLGSSDEKVGVVEKTRKKIVDRQNGFKLLEHFSFSADKEKVRKLLK
ncbi:MAG: DUF4476 domain-containing protein [Myxococcaceae bacterium]|jgi:hypothetical protein|nr:DUF4476 domain-containing protein [Myxococcaceae bacterium]